MNTASKLITYRGGIVTFRLPAHWREEYAPEGGGTFYDPDRPDSGTLRLNVLSMHGPPGASAEQGVAAAFPACSFEWLANGLALRHRIVSSHERGEALHLHRWEIAIPVPPDRVRLACFTYAILACQEHEPDTVAELALVAQSVRAADYARQAGA